MIRRCKDIKHPRYYRYGGRGLKVAAEWIGLKGLVAFYESIGDPTTAKHQLDRINNDKGYEPGNVRWVTTKQQARNRSDTVKIKLGNLVLCLKDAATLMGINTATASRRIQLGWTPLEAVTTPTHKHTKVK